jgi:AraC-type DNA-binding domain-containing proteins
MNTFLETRKYESDFPVCAFVNKDNNFLAHWHIDVEMMFVCEGSIRIGINQESKVLSQGEMAIFGSADIHYYDSRGMHSTIIVVIFRPELVGSPGGWPENLCFIPGFMDLSKLKESTANTVREIFQSIAAEMNEANPLSCFGENNPILSHATPVKYNRPYYKLLVKGKILELCALALRHFPTCSLSPNPKGNKMPDIQKIQFAIQYLENNYMHDISLTQIAGKSNLSPYYFSRLFTKFTAMTFKEYLAGIRIARAEQLIKAGEKTITDISFDCGFNSVRTFNRTFKTVKGFSPSQTRLLENG